jgi:hypothetical protein
MRCVSRALKGTEEARFLHTLSEARSLATIAWKHRSTQRKDFLEKDDLKKMEAKLLLSLPEGLEVTNIDLIDGVLTIFAVSTQNSACCPLCSSLGTRVHGHYTRTIADLPCAGQEVAPADASA